MSDVRKNYDEAEPLYRKALELDPKHAIHTGNFARFMKNVRQNYDEAERLYRKAVSLDPRSELWKEQLTKLVKEHRMLKKQ